MKGETIDDCDNGDVCESFSILHYQLECDSCAIKTT